MKQTNEFNNFFTDIGLKLAKKTPESSQPFESHMKKVSTEMENKPLSINELKDAFFSLKITKVQVMMILVTMLLVNVLGSYVPL